MSNQTNASDLSDGQRLLACNRSFCDAAVKSALSAARQGMTEHALAWANVAGECGWNMHPGYYAHYPLEAMLREIGDLLGENPTPVEDTLPTRKNGAKTYLHVLTTALPIGGHTRLVERIIANTTSGINEQHSVVLVDQGTDEIPAWLRKAVEDTGGGLCVFPKGIGFTDRARMLRQIAREWADTVLLHIHPSDSASSLAFASPGGPPVVFINHADHVFWLGAACSDVVADIRPEGQDLTINRRGDTPSILLPIPLEPIVNEESSENARNSLGISCNRIVLLAIASSYKFVPYGELDFPALAADILKRNKNAVLLVVGPSESETCWQHAVAVSEGRLKLFGIQPNIDRFYAAADICLESFPVGSLTSTLDAMLRGIPVVRAPRGTPPILALTQYDGMMEPAENPEAYVDQVSTLICDRVGRLTAGNAQRRAVLNLHTGQSWHNSWQKLINSLPAVHKPLRPVITDQWDVSVDSDAIWADIQKRQNRYVDYLKWRIRVNFRSCPWLDVTRMWLSALFQGNWKVFKILFRNVTQFYRTP